MKPKQLEQRLKSVEDNSKLWNINKESIARELDIARGTIYKWWKKPTLERVQKIELAFQILQKKKAIMSDPKEMHDLMKYLYPINF
jgi:transposase-like protein